MCEELKYTFFSQEKSLPCSQGLMEFTPRVLINTDDMLSKFLSTLLHQIRQTTTSCTEQSHGTPRTLQGYSGKIQISKNDSTRNHAMKFKYTALWWTDLNQGWKEYLEKQAKSFLQVTVLHTNNNKSGGLWLKQYRAHWLDCLSQRAAC